MRRCERDTDSSVPGHRSQLLTLLLRRINLKLKFLPGESKPFFFTRSQIRLERVESKQVIYGLFPRLNERGSIEATIALHIRGEKYWFPRLNERGSIEAGLSFLCDSLYLLPFPRLNERGSIEASGKRQKRGASVILFPRLNERGSIEALLLAKS
jgi:hypothetical protein